MKFLPLLLLPLTAFAGDGLFTHTVTENGAIVHQLVQDVFSGSVIVDEWYAHPRADITAMLVTTRGHGGPTNFVAKNHSALTWYSTGGERSNFWNAPIGETLPIRSGGSGSVVDSGRVHTFSSVLGTKPPRLSLYRTYGKDAKGEPYYDLDVLVKAPAKTQFEIFESVGSATNWQRLCTAEKPIGAGTSIVFDKPLTNKAAFYRARTVWPRVHSDPEKLGIMETVVGEPTWLPKPIEPSSVPAGPPVPPKRK